MLVEDVFNTSVGEEFVGQRLRQLVAKTPGEVDNDLPVVARLARCANRWRDVRDAPLAVGDRAFFLAPRAGRQHDVGVIGGIGVAVGFLQNDQFGGLQGGAHFALIGQRLRRIGAGDPHRLDFAALQRSKELDSGLARLLRHVGDAPKTRHFGTMYRVGQITVRRKQVR